MQMLKLKKERQLLDTRSRAMLGLPTIQRKEVEELKARLATEQTEHHEKEKRWRLTVHLLNLTIIPSPGSLRVFLNQVCMMQ
jgi:hypothetical protein